MTYIIRNELLDLKSSENYWVKIFCIIFCIIIFCSISFYLNFKKSLPMQGKLCDAQCEALTIVVEIVRVLRMRGSHVAVKSPD